MPQVIKMPSEAELSPGPMRDFVEFLQMLYHDARRPTLRRISKEVVDGDYDATASTETIRKMLRGIRVPFSWKTTEAVVLALCSIAGLDPKSYHVFHNAYATLTIHAARLWQLALEQTPPQSPEPAISSDDASELRLIIGASRVVPGTVGRGSLSFLDGALDPVAWA